MSVLAGGEDQPSEEAEEEEEEEEFDWQVEQEPYEETTLTEGPKYGFANQRCGVFHRLQVGKILYPSWIFEQGSVCECVANKRQRYIVTLPLISWVHSQNDPCLNNHTESQSEEAHRLISGVIFLLSPVIMLLQSS